MRQQGHNNSNCQCYICRNMRSLDLINLAKNVADGTERAASADQKHVQAANAGAAGPQNDEVQNPNPLLSIASVI